MKTSKEALLDIAFAMFLDRGYDGVTMQDLVAASGVSKGAFHYHFSRKPDLWDACIEQFFVRFLPHGENINASSGSGARELIASMTGTYREMMAEFKRIGVDTAAYWRFVLALPESRRLQLAEGIMQAESALCTAFAADISLGAITLVADPAILARQALALLEGEGVLLAIGGGAAEPEKVIDAWLAMIYAKQSEDPENRLPYRG